MDKEIRLITAQNTGNPVLDATVNLCASYGAMKLQSVEAVHALLLKLAEKEPGGLKRGSDLHPSISAAPRRAKSSELKI